MYFEGSIFISQLITLEAPKGPPKSPLHSCACLSLLLFEGALFALSVDFAIVLKQAAYRAYGWLRVSTHLLNMHMCVCVCIYMCTSHMG